MFREIGYNEICAKESIYDGSLNNIAAAFPGGNNSKPSSATCRCDDLAKYFIEKALGMSCVSFTEWHCNETHPTSLGLGFCHGDEISSGGYYSD